MGDAADVEQTQKSEQNENDQNIINENETTKEKPISEKAKKKQEKEALKKLLQTKVKFKKKIDFDTALTDEEKAARKKAKEEKKHKPKKKKSQSEVEQAPSETKATEQTADESEGKKSDNVVEQLPSKESTVKDEAKSKKKPKKAKDEKPKKAKKEKVKSVETKDEPKEQTQDDKSAVREDGKAAEPSTETDIETKPKKKGKKGKTKSDAGTSDTKQKEKQAKQKRKEKGNKKTKEKKVGEEISEKPEDQTETVDETQTEEKDIKSKTKKSKKKGDKTKEGKEKKDKEKVKGKDKKKGKKGTLDKKADVSEKEGNVQTDEDKSLKEKGSKVKEGEESTEEQKDIIEPKTEESSASYLSYTSYEGSEEEQEITKPEDETQAEKKKKKKGKGKKKGRAKKHEKEEKIVIDLEEEAAGATDAEKSPEIATEIEKEEIQTDDEGKLDKKKDKKKKKKKPKDKKKKTKKKAKLSPEMLEKLRLEAEEQEAIRREEERLRMEEEKKAAIKEENAEREEQLVRMMQLKNTNDFEESLIDDHISALKKYREKMEWDLYVACRKLPIPTKTNAMNTYLHLWDLEINNTTVEKMVERTTDVVQMLIEIDDLFDTKTDEPESVLATWKWMQILFRQYQHRNLHVATYNLLKNIVENLHRIDIPTADYSYKNETLSIYIWLRVPLPIPLPNARRSEQPRRIEFSCEDMNMNILFPMSIDCENKVIRTMYCNYDHYSDLCSLYKDPVMSEALDQSLADYTLNEYKRRLQYKFDNRDIKMLKFKVEKKKTEGEGDINENKSPDEEEQEFEEREALPDLGTFEDIPLVAWKKLEVTDKEFVASIEEKLYEDLHKSFEQDLPPHILNLRKYRILGGVFIVHYLMLPPQPQEFITFEMSITPCYVPKQMFHADFYEEYTPPKPPEPGVTREPEEIEEELRKQEMELDKLILINLKLPQHVIFIEPPIVCQWSDEENLWSTKDIHDLKHNEEQGTLSFRTGRFAEFGLATLRYANLPYQMWDMRPEVDSSVTIQLTSAILVLEFNFKDGLVCLRQIQNSPNPILQDRIGKYYKLQILRRTLIEAGIDVFPSFDAFLYVQVGACEKLWPMEKHTYFCMAALSNCFNFTWSRWNLPIGRRSIVMQMREFQPEKTKQRIQNTCYITPMKAALVDCTEVSQTFNEEPLPYIKYSADLLELMKTISGITTRSKVQQNSRENIYTLSRFLMATRIHSFS